MFINDSPANTQYSACSDAGVGGHFGNTLILPVNKGAKVTFKYTATAQKLRFLYAEGSEND